MRAVCPRVVVLSGQGVQEVESRPELNVFSGHRSHDPRLAELMKLPIGQTGEKQNFTSRNGKLRIKVPCSTSLFITSKSQFSFLPN